MVVARRAKVLRRREEMGAIVEEWDILMNFGRKGIGKCSEI